MLGDGVMFATRQTALSQTKFHFARTQIKSGLLILLILTLLYSFSVTCGGGNGTISKVTGSEVSYGQFHSRNTDLTGSVGDSHVPLSPANTRIITVAKDGSGRYTSIQAAVKASKPGDTIKVKNGTYVERVNFTINGTQSKPITLMNYPGHSPVIDPGGKQYSDDATKRVLINASWIIIDGFEIKYGWDGIKVLNPHVTIRNNHIHHNKYQGILVTSVGDILIENNKIEWNGTDPGTCVKSKWGGFSPKHCHAIYVGDYFCTGVSNITIRRNTLQNQAGRGVQWNGKTQCLSPGFTNQLVENNLFVNNSVHLMLFYGVKDSVFRNNTFVATSYPSTNDKQHANVGIWGNATGNTFRNNIFYSTLKDYKGINSKTTSTFGTRFDCNVWKVSTDSWTWNNTGRKDFTTNYQKVTGWDGNGRCCEVDPGFVNISKGDYSIDANSSTRNIGANSECLR